MLQATRSVPSLCERKSARIRCLYAASKSNDERKGIAQRPRVPVTEPLLRENNQQNSILLAVACLACSRSHISLTHFFIRRVYEFAVSSTSISMLLCHFGTIVPNVATLFGIIRLNSIE